MKGKKNPLQSSSKVCVIFFTDGRDKYTTRMLESFHENVKFPIPVHKLLMIDNPDQDMEFIAKITKKYKIDQVIHNPERLKIAGSVQKAWANIPEDCDYVWHQENDFLFNEPVKTEDFIKVLGNKLIHQVALLRQAWYDNEVKAGGIIQSNPRAYKRASIMGVSLTVHRSYFTHNPCMYKKSVTKIFQGYGEYAMMGQLFKGGWCAYYGSKTDAPRVTHIGEEKV